MQPRHPRGILFLYACHYEGKEGGGKTLPRREHAANNGFDILALHLQDISWEAMRVEDRADSNAAKRDWVGRTKTESVFRRHTTD